MSADLALYEQLNKELVSLVDHFTSLVKATREGARPVQQQQGCHGLVFCNGTAGYVCVCKQQHGRQSAAGIVWWAALLQACLRLHNPTCNNAAC
jgi:hypothetical protein